MNDANSVRKVGGLPEIRHGPAGASAASSPKGGKNATPRVVTNDNPCTFQNLVTTRLAENRWFHTRCCLPCFVVPHFDEFLSVIHYDAFDTRTSLIQFSKSCALHADSVLRISTTLAIAQRFGLHTASKLPRFGLVERLVGPRGATATRPGRLWRLDLPDCGRLGDFVLGLGSCTASTTAVAGCWRSGRRSHRIRRGFDSHVSTPLWSSTRAELRVRSDQVSLFDVRQWVFNPHQPHVSMRCHPSGGNDPGCVKALQAVVCAQRKNRTRSHGDFFMCAKPHHQDVSRSGLRLGQSGPHGPRPIPRRPRCSGTSCAYAEQVNSGYFPEIVPSSEMLFRCRTPAPSPWTKWRR